MNYQNQLLERRHQIEWFTASGLWELYDGVLTIWKPALTTWAECFMWMLIFWITMTTKDLYVLQIFKVYILLQYTACTAVYSNVCNWRPIVIIMNKEWGHTFHFSCSKCNNQRVTHVAKTRGHCLICKSNWKFQVEKHRKDKFSHVSQGVMNFSCKLLLT